MLSGEFRAFLAEASGSIGIAEQEVKITGPPARKNSIGAGRLDLAGNREGLSGYGNSSRRITRNPQGKRPESTAMNPPINRTYAIRQGDYGRYPVHFIEF